MPVTRVTDSQIRSKQISDTAGYVEDMKQRAMVNILKANFKIDTYMNASVNRMDNVVVDVFSDQKGIDPNNSAYTFDLSQRLVKNNTAGSSITHNTTAAFQTWNLNGMSLEYPSGFGPAPELGEIMPKSSVTVLNDDGKQKGNVVVSTDHEGFIHMAYEARRADSDIWGIDYAVLTPEGQIIRRMQLVPDDGISQYVVRIGAASFVESEAGRTEGPISYVITRYVDPTTSATCYELRVVVRDTILPPIDVSYMKAFSARILVDELGHGHFSYVSTDNQGYWTKVWVEGNAVRMNIPFNYGSTTSTDIVLGRDSHSQYAMIIGGSPNARIITDMIGKGETSPKVIIAKGVDIYSGFWVEYINPGLWAVPATGLGMSNVIALYDMQLNRLWHGLDSRYRPWAYGSAIYRWNSSALDDYPLQPIIQEADTLRVSSLGMEIQNVYLLVVGPASSLVLVRLNGNGYRLYIWRTPRYKTQTVTASRVFDGGGLDTVWTSVSWTVKDPSVIGMNQVEYRISNDLQTWSDWKPTTSGAMINQSGRYLELRVSIISTGPGPYYQNVRVNFNATVSVVQSQPIAVTTVPNRAILSADYNPGTNGSVRFYLSRDGGATWVPAVPDSPVSFDDYPDGTSLVMKAELTGDSTLTAWGLSWS